MLRVKITSTDGEIGVKTTPAKMSIQQPRPRFKLNQRPAELIVKRERLNLVIDQTECFADLGNKKISRLMSEYAKRSKQVCLETIGETARVGSKISKAGKLRHEMVKKLLREKLLKKRHDTVLVALPKQRPKIRFEGGRINISWVVHHPEFEHEISSRPIITVQPHSVKIYMRKFPSLEIEIIDDDKESGKQVDKKI